MTDDLGFILGLILLAALYLVLSLIAGARFALGDLTAERVAEESGLSWSFDPGSRPYEAAKLLRLSLLTLTTVLAATGPASWCGVGAGITAGMIAIVADILVQTLLSPRAPRRILSTGAPLLRGIDLVFGPLVAPLARAHDRIATQHRVTTSESDEQFRDEQLEGVIENAVEEGLLEPEEGALVREIADAGERVAREVMTPKVEIEAVNAAASVEDCLATFTRSRHSRLLVFESSLDRVVGVLVLRDLLPHLGPVGRSSSARALMRPVMHVPATKPVLELLRELQHSRQQIAVVVDEYGNTAGLVSLEDLVEEIVGEIRDEHERPEDEIRADGKGGWLIDGLIQIGEVEQRLGIELSDENVETLGGLLFSQIGRVPRVGERVTLPSGAVLEAARIEGRRIAVVRVALSHSAAG